MEKFRKWLNSSYQYSDRTVSNILSRVKRANKILNIHHDDIYLFELEQEPEFNILESSVKSQIKKAIKLYLEFQGDESKKKIGGRRKVLSLFANIGVAEATLSNLNFDVVVANELDARRSKLYGEIYPDTDLVVGDIRNNSIMSDILEKSKSKDVEIVLATPPCQAMSTAGPKVLMDERNYLFLPVLKIIQELKPNYIMFENVPQFLKTKIIYQNEPTLIPDVISKEVGNEYEIRKYVVNMKNYSIPQSRERAIILLTKKGNCLKPWTLPEQDKKMVTLKDAIGHLPPIDPWIKDIEAEEMGRIFPLYYERKEEALKYSKWNIPPHHIMRQVEVMRHTSTGDTAFNNEKYFPIKENGERVKGFKNTYKRQSWDMPAYTITMDNRKISSQGNVHPGRYLGKDEEGYEVYSDARVLTLYELMLIMTLPATWNIPNGTSEAFLRRIIGEGIPPLFVNKVFDNLN